MVNFEIVWIVVTLVFKFFVYLSDYISDIWNSKQLIQVVSVEYCGIAGLVIVFMPGVITGMVMLIHECNKDSEERSATWIVIWLLLLVLFPFAIPILVILQLYNVYKELKKGSENVQEGEIYKTLKMLIVATLGIESSIESFSQIVLNIFTLLRKYPATTIQKWAILSSFLQLGVSSIGRDIELVTYGKDDDNTLDIKDLIYATLKKYIPLLPCFVSTITFRAMSLSLTMAYFCWWAIIPISLLFIELTICAFWRIKKPTKLGQFVEIIFLIVANAGTMSAYIIADALDKVDEDDKDDEAEKQKAENAASFIKWSTWIHFIHHSIVLSAIMAIAKWDWSPDWERWWEDQIAIKPSTSDFYWSLWTTLGLGMFSTLLLHYRARHVAKNK